MDEVTESNANEEEPGWNPVETLLLKPGQRKNLGGDGTGRRGCREWHNSILTGRHIYKGEDCEVESLLGLTENKIISVLVPCFIRVQGAEGSK